MSKEETIQIQQGYEGDDFVKNKITIVVKTKEVFLYKKIKRNCQKKYKETVIKKLIENAKMQML